MAAYAASNPSQGASESWQNTAIQWQYCGYTTVPLTFLRQPYQRKGTFIWQMCSDKRVYPLIMS
jgi:hypothetical protein